MEGPRLRRHRMQVSPDSSNMPALLKEIHMRFFLICFVLLTLVPALAGCGAINPGKWKGIEKTSSDEHFYLVKDVFLTSGSSASPRESFDHKMHDVVNLFFQPKDERNAYVAESRWIDPLGIEYRNVRTSYDKQDEGKKGIERPKGGATRIHTMTTAELYAHKPGMWKVELYLDGKLVRRLSFSIR
jgi:hypothetical protein